MPRRRFGTILASYNPRGLIPALLLTSGVFALLRRLGPREDVFLPRNVGTRSVTQSTTKDYYDNAYHKIRGSKQNYGQRFLDSAMAAFPVDKYPRWLDAGTGNCGVLRKLLDAGYDAYGTDLSTVSLEQSCPDLVKLGKATAVPLHALPFESGQFDVIFSSDVLEHVPEEDVRKSIAELVRVSRTGVFFMTISLRLSNYDLNKPIPVSHVTVHPRSWWEAIFAQHGCSRNEQLLSQLQKRIPAQITEDLAKKMARAKPGHEFWRDGEKEPWFFIFNCEAPINVRRSTFFGFK